MAGTRRDPAAPTAELRVDLILVELCESVDVPLMSMNSVDWCQDHSCIDSKLVLDDFGTAWTILRDLVPSN